MYEVAKAGIEMSDILVLEFRGAVGLLIFLLDFPWHKNPQTTKKIGLVLLENSAISWIS